MSTTPVVQFGTSRFLQAHADLFLSEAAPGTASVTVVQTSGDPGRRGRLAALAEGYDVRVRGLVDARVVDEVVRVGSIARGLSIEADRPEVMRILAEDAQFVLSNTADAGFAPRPEDRGHAFDPRQSFPAKLAHLLRPRFEAGGTPLQVMPTELVQDNGQVLRDLVVAAAAGMEPGYRDWLRDEVVWTSSLVDRIVSEPIEPAGAVAEPYALWAVEARPGVRAPCIHPAVQLVRNLGPVERRKLFVLNLGHSWMVSEWLARGRTGPGLVREVMADPAAASRLRALYAEEVVPAFHAAGEGDAIEDYVRLTFDRLANPFLDHPLADIAANHAHKLERRIAAFLRWARDHGDGSPKPRLERALEIEA